jgi:hypothetical protein
MNFIWRHITYLVFWGVAPCGSYGGRRFGGRVASVVGVAGFGGLGVPLGVVGGRRADAERPCVGCWWLLARFLARRFWSPWWVGAVRSSAALVLAGAAQRGIRRTQFFFVTFRFLLPFLFFSVVFCVVFIFDVYVLCI